MDFLVTHVFNSGKYGWSENWYYTATTYGDAMTAAKELAEARYPLLARGVLMEAIRVSDVLVRGDSSVFLPPANQPVDPLLAPDNPWNGLLSRVESGPLYRRMFVLRGLPDDKVIVTLPSHNVEWGGAYQALWDDFELALVDKFKLRVIDKGAPNGTEKAVTGLGPEPGGTGTLITVDAAGIAEGDEIRLRQFHGTTGGSTVDAVALNGVWRAKSPQAGSFVIGKAFAELLDPGNLTLGKMVRRVIVYKTISSAALLRGGHRDTGRAFFVSRGRRRVAR